MVLEANLATASQRIPSPKIKGLGCGPAQAGSISDFDLEIRNTGRGGTVANELHRATAPIYARNPRQPE